MLPVSRAATRARIYYGSIGSRAASFKPRHTTAITQRQLSNHNGVVDELSEVAHRRNAEAAKEHTVKVASQSAGKVKSAAKASTGKSKAPAESKKTLKVDLGDGAPRLLTWDKLTLNLFNVRDRTYSALQIRDSCSCLACRDPSSGQKSYATVQLHDNLSILDVTVKEDGSLCVLVDAFDPAQRDAEHKHEVLLSSTWVKSNATPVTDPCLVRYEQVFWDASTIESRVRRVDYEQFMQEDSTGFWDVVQDIVRFGLVFLRNVPRDEDSVKRIAQRLGTIQDTFYGRTFDVRAKPDAENVAYTDGYLGLHQDLCYLQPQPFIQILHAMDNSCEGGESLFSDSHRVGRMMCKLQQDNPLAKLLSNIRVPYGYSRNGHCYKEYRPVIESTRSRTQFEKVYWSPPFQAEWQLGHSPTVFRAWQQAAKVFEQAINAPEAMFQTRLEPGDCVIFNNNRVLHGRTAFNSTQGSRWLRGTYIAEDSFLSTARQAPASHAAPVDQPEKYWNVKEAEETLKTQPLYTWLEKELQTRQAAVGYKPKKPKGKKTTGAKQSSETMRNSEAREHIESTDRSQHETSMFR